MLCKRKMEIKHSLTKTGSAYNKVASGGLGQPKGTIAGPAVPLKRIRK